MDNIEGLKRVKAPVSSCVEPRLVEAIVGVASLVAVRGKIGVDEALLEEASRYPHFETCSFLSFWGRGLSSSSSFCGGKKKH